MKDAQMKRRLEMLHAQAASLLVGIETLMADHTEGGATSGTGCAHPAEKRQKIQMTLNDSKQRYRCGDCGDEIT